MVEQPAHIGFRHGRIAYPGAEASELQTRTVIILGVGLSRMLERGDRPGTVAEPVADGAKRKPRRGETRRKLDRLRHDIGGCRKIPARGLVERPFVAPVGDEIAGRDEEWAGIGHRALAPRERMIIYDSRCVLKTS